MLVLLHGELHVAGINGKMVLAVVLAQELINKVPVGVGSIEVGTIEIESRLVGVSGAAPPSGAFHARDLHVAIGLRQVHGDGEAGILAVSVAHLPCFVFAIAIFRDGVAAAVDLQSIVIIVGLHVVIPAFDTYTERESATCRDGVDGIGIHRSRGVGKLVVAGHVVVARRAVDGLRRQQIHIVGMHNVWHHEECQQDADCTYLQG